MDDRLRAELEALYPEHVATLGKGYGRSLESNGFDGVLIHAGSPKIRSIFDDQYWPLRVTPHYQHWLPLAVADGALLVLPGRRPVLFHNVERSFWEGPVEPESDHFWGAFDVVEVDGPSKIRHRLPPGRLAFVGEDLPRASSWGFSPDAINPERLVAALDALRTRKTAYERAALAEANRRAAAGHERVLAAFRDGERSELELHLLFLEATRQDDVETPYKNIVALGNHAATLHHVGYSRRAGPAEALLLDAGATCLGYASDVTRTAVKGRSAAAQVFAELVIRLDRLQQAICAEVKPGVPYESLHNRAHERLAPILRELGIARGSDAELVESGVTRKFLPHGLGHSLGLQTHDVGCAVVRPEPRNPFLRNTSTVEVGQVFTVEPGCYFIDSLLEELRASDEGRRVDWKLVDELKRFGGVRIEDDLVVEASGARNLTREFLPA